MIKGFESLFDENKINDKVVVFDLDGTLLFGDLGETVFFSVLLMNGLGIRQDQFSDYIRKLVKADEIRIPDNPELAKTLSQYLDHFQAHQMEAAYCLTARYLAGYSPEHLYSFVEQTLRGGIPKTRVKVVIGNEIFFLNFHAMNDPFLGAVIKGCHQRQARVLIVSASPQAIVEGYCKFQGLPLEIAKGAARDSNGHYAVPYGKAKMHLLSEEGVVQPYIAFGNSEGDFEMLDAALYSFVRKTDNAEIVARVKAGKWQFI